MKLPNIDTVALFLLIIGGLNAGVAAVFDYNAISSLLGGSSMVSTVVYALMGLSAVWMLADHFNVLGRNDA